MAAPGMVASDAEIPTKIGVESARAGWVANVVSAAPANKAQTAARTPDGFLDMSFPLSFRGSLAPGETIERCAGVGNR
jgi:hypothetical protein